jgi:hypothetical protein
VIVKYDSDGAVKWARSVGAGNAYSKLFNAAAGPSGAVFAVGYVSGGGLVTFDSGVSLMGVGLSTALPVVVKHDGQGRAVWVKSATKGSAPAKFQGVAAGGGRVYAAGEIQARGACGFGPEAALGASSSTLRAVLVMYGDE